MIDATPPPLILPPHYRAARPAIIRAAPDLPKLAMLPGMMGAITSGRRSMQSVLNVLGLTTDLVLCLDPGDATSYSGTGQQWLDTSGNTFTMDLGDTTSSEASDPTFNGVAGRLSAAEYFSFDGGDYFTKDSANATWVNTLHKNSALFSCCCWANVATTATYNSAWGTAGDTLAKQGASWKLTGSTAHPALVVVNGSATALNQASTLSPSTGAWQFHSLSYDEAAGNLTFGLNGTYDAETGKTYSSPGTGNAADKFQVGAHGEGSGSSRNFQNGALLGPVAMWSGIALTQANMTAIFNATRTRYGV